MAEESVSDHDASLVSSMMNTSSCECEELREPGYEADHEFSSDDCRGNEVALYIAGCLFTCSLIVCGFT